MRSRRCNPATLIYTVMLTAMAQLQGQVAIPNLDDEEGAESGANAPIQIAPIPDTPLPSPPLQSPLPSAEEPGDIRDIRDPVSIPNPWLPYLIAGAAFLVLIILGFLIYFIVKRLKSRPAVPPINPYDQALEDLRATRLLMKAGCDKEFSIAVSDAVRYFLERQFALPAPEFTTEEFLSHIQDHDLIKEKLADTFSDFLRQCDMAKFARQAFGLSGMSDLYGKAETLIEETYLKQKMKAAVLENA